MAFTDGNDINILQGSDGAIVGAGLGDDIYIVSPVTLTAGQEVTISDTDGTNTLQLIGGLTIASSVAVSNALQLTLSNGAIINVNGADNFNFNVGGNAVTGETGEDKDFSTFAQEDLGVTVPAEGEPAATGGAAEIGVGPVPDAIFTVTAADTDVDEGATTTFNVASTDTDEGDTVAYTITGVDAADVVGGELTGTATVDADGNAVISVELVEDVSLNEGAETMTVTLAGGATADVTVNDTSMETTFTLTTDAAGNKVLEGETFNVTVTANQAVTEDTDVVLTLVQGTALSSEDQDTDQTNVNDFVEGTFNDVTVTILAGETEVTYSGYAPKSDGLTEQQEAFSVTAEVAGEALTPLDLELLDGAGVYDLTTSVDDVEGTLYDDTINGLFNTPGGGATDMTTVTALDTIDGDDGDDVFNITGVTAVDTTAVAGLSVSNVEIVNARSAAGLIVNTSSWTGVDNLNVTQALGATTVTGADTTAINVAGVTDFLTTVNGGSSTTVTQGLDVGADGIIVNTAGTVNITATDSKDAAQGATGTLGIEVTAATGAVNITATGEAVDSGTVTDAMAEIKSTGGTTVNVTQSATSDMGTIAADKSAQTITQGAVTVVGGTDTTEVTVVQDDQVTAVAALDAVTAVSATKVVTFVDMVAGETTVIDGLTFTASKTLTAAEVAAAFANLEASDVQENGGPTVNGIYSGALSANWTSGAVSGDKVTFSEVVAGGAVPALVISDTAAAGNVASATGATGVTAVTAVTGVLGVANGAVRVDGNGGTASITTLTVDGYSGGADLGSTGADLNALTTLSLANSGAGAANVATSATALDLTLNDVDGAVNLDQTGATVATLNITTEGVNSATAMTAGAVTELNVDGTQLVSLTADLSVLEQVAVTGSAGLTLAAASANTIKSVDASGTSGNVTTSLDSGIATYAGGSGMDTVTTVTTTAPTKAITLGAGNDTIVLATGTTAMGVGGTINGGDDTDTLSMLTANAVTAGGSTAFSAGVTNFENLVLTGATGTQSVDVGKLGSYNNVNVLSAAAGSQTTLTGLTTGATIVLRDGDANVTTDRVIATITDAATGTADVLNIDLQAAGTNTASDDNGIINAANVENINISVTDVYNTTPEVAASVQTLTLEATKAETITITGDTALTLTNAGNTAVTAINASTMTGALTVQAAGTVSTTITGGSGNDVLTASNSIGFGGVVNAAGTAAAITNDAVAGVDGVNAIYTIDLVGAVTNDDGDTITFTNGGASGTYTEAAGGSNATAIASAMIATSTLAVDGVTYNVTAGANATSIILTATTAVTEAANMVMLVVDDAAEGGITQATTASQAITTNGVLAVPEQATVVLTDGTTNTGLTVGDTMALDVNGSTFTYTAAATVTMDTAAAALAALIQADAGVTTAAYNAGADTITITAAASTATDIAVSNYLVTDFGAATAAADTLIGGDGNDTLVAGNLATLTGGAGNDRFNMNTVLTNVNSYSTITDFSSGDVIISTATTFDNDGTTLAGTAVFQDYANAAINNTVAGEATWFQFGTNTYVVDNANGGANDFSVADGDTIIALTGIFDLGADASFSTSGTIELA